MTNSGGVGGNGRARNAIRLIIGVIIALVGLVVVGGGIALFLTALIR